MDLQNDFYIHKLSAKQSKPIAIMMLLNGNNNGVTKGQENKCIWYCILNFQK